MGMFNTYGKVQLKVADELTLKQFNDGDNVDIPDGIYAGYDGFVVIEDGKMVGEYEKITTSWGHEIQANDFVDKYNPLLPLIPKDK